MLTAPPVAPAPTAPSERAIGQVKLILETFQHVIDLDKAEKTLGAPPELPDDDLQTLK